MLPSGLIQSGVPAGFQKGVLASSWVRGGVPRVITTPPTLYEPPETPPPPSAPTHLGADTPAPIGPPRHPRPRAGAPCSVVARVSLWGVTRPPSPIVPPYPPHITHVPSHLQPLRHLPQPPNVPIMSPCSHVPMAHAVTRSRYVLALCTRLCRCTNTGSCPAATCMHHCMLAPCLHPLVHAPTRVFAPMFAASGTRCTHACVCTHRCIAPCLCTHPRAPPTRVHGRSPAVLQQQPWALTKPPESAAGVGPCWEGRKPPACGCSNLCAPAGCRGRAGGGEQRRAATPRSAGS